MDVKESTIVVDRGTRLGNFLEAMDSLYGANPSTSAYETVLEEIDRLTSWVHLVADSARDEEGKK